MPKVPEPYRQCVFYLFDSREEAERGSGFGGTGFFVMVRSQEVPGLVHVHGVSNWHVAVNGGSSVLRINTRNGKPEIFDFDPSDWLFEPGGPDIAITPPIPIDVRVHKARALDELTMFLSDEKIKRSRVGAGEDVFMVGRFVDIDSGPTNDPALRFGNISVMPTPIRHDTGAIVRTYCIDLHSRSGFSGSPVFAYRTFGTDLGEPGKLDPRMIFSGFLGIHIGQFHEDWELSFDGKPRVRVDQDEPLYLDSKNVKINGLSGMTCVAPAWQISKLLHSPEAEDMRRKVDGTYEGPPAPQPESSRKREDSDGDDARRDAVLKTMLNTPPKPHNLKSEDK